MAMIAAIQFDADGQHLPEYIDSMVKAVSDADIVIGSRFVDTKKPHSMRMLGSNLISWAIRITTRQSNKRPDLGNEGL